MPACLSHIGAHRQQPKSQLDLRRAGEGPAETPGFSPILIRFFAPGWEPSSSPAKSVLGCSAKPPVSLRARCDSRRRHSSQPERRSCSQGSTGGCLIIHPIDGTASGRASLFPFSGVLLCAWFLWTAELRPYTPSPPEPASWDALIEPLAYGLPPHHSAVVDPGLSPHGPSAPIIDGASRTSRYLGCFLYLYPRVHLLHDDRSDWPGCACYVLISR
jgi:hypothetical protein